MLDISRIPVIAISNVLGIGVADIAKTSTFVLAFFNSSLCSTPNRCSSSITNNPKFANSISFESNLCVPITTSITPDFKPAIISFVWVAVLNLESAANRTGKPAYLFEKVFRCCCTSNVVGTSIATCLLSCTALKAARTAISVFP